MNRIGNIITDIGQLVINWHITEACNYSCHYCYAKWDQGSHKRELFHNIDQSKKLISDLYDFFHPSNKDNPLINILKWDSIRLNFAGGEPTLYKEKLMSILDFAKKMGFEVSIITNGSMLRDINLVKNIAKNTSILGLSIDSGSSLSNKAIGRVGKNGDVCSVIDIKNALMIAKEINPNLFIKINTVVNEYNFHENMVDVISALRPDKWKVLRMLPITTEDLSITDGQFNEFIRNHNCLKHLMRVEDNQDMRESYLMIDPIGRFFQNASAVSHDSIYIYSSEILESGVLAAFEQIPFSTEKFTKRYL